MFEYKSIYSSYKDCYFKVSKYNNGNLAVEIWNLEDGPIARITVNPGMVINPKEYIAIKDYSENAGMVDWLYSQGFIDSEPVDIVASGIPVYRLTDKWKEELGI